MNKDNSKVNLFICIYRQTVLRRHIFHFINEISAQRNINALEGQKYLKGKDIIQLRDIRMISKYALPWHFVKHYLPDDRKKIGRYVRWQAINKYASHPNATVETLQHLIEWSPHVDFVGDYLDKTAINGNLDILKMIHQRYPNTIIHTKKSVEGAAKNGHLSVIQFLDSIDKQVQPLIFTTQVMDNAASGGHKSLVEWLHQNRNEGGTERAIKLASENGHFDCVKYLVENMSIKKGTEEAMNMAALNGHYDIVVYLHQHSYICTTRAIDGAAAKGHLNIIKFLQENRTEGCSRGAMNISSANGHLDCVRFLHNHRSEGCTTDAMDEASANGHLSVVEYLHHNRSEGCTKYALDSAAKSNHLSIVKFLVKNRTEGCSSRLNHIIEDLTPEIASILVPIIPPIELSSDDDNFYDDTGDDDDDQVYNNYMYSNYNYSSSAHFDFDEYYWEP
ncbi:hypothetical protein DFA_07739 [Cavenderia fasciculata]|uniref:Ankyrin repeat-containing protein n=1 Tax=Cavenderia fasciculata TaxID=261658 RepID=F4Q339_CACFS|nr:uncharacterized protein DFA_07739 [Cavenderia fasciculata]EGG16761.1 hypothetical protein DFA_07739 [Cavenderia fasciculata]|eukprot:XP_004355235.1 hypothetical protein DFA_07739 [Cavenderia fasciculata]